LETSVFTKIFVLNVNKSLLDRYNTPSVDPHMKVYSADNTKTKKKRSHIPIYQRIFNVKFFGRGMNLLIKIYTLADMTKEQIQDLRDRVTSLRRHL